MLMIRKWWYFVDRMAPSLIELILLCEWRVAKDFFFVIERLTSSNWHICCHRRANEGENEQVEEEEPKQRRRPDSHAGWMELAAPNIKNLWRGDERRKMKIGGKEEFLWKELLSLRSWGLFFLGGGITTVDQIKLEGWRDGWTRDVWDKIRRGPKERRKKKKEEVEMCKESGESKRS